MPLTFTRTRDLFLQILEGQKPDAALVDDLIKKASKEDQWLDYKEEGSSHDKLRTLTEMGHRFRQR